MGIYLFKIFVIIYDEFVVKHEIDYGEFYEKWRFTRIKKILSTLDDEELKQRALYLKDLAIWEQAVPVAFVQIDESQRNHRTDEDLRSVLLSKSTENLEQPSVPVDFVFVDELPINAGGKIDQGLIRKQADIDFDRDHGKVLKKSLSFREK